MGPVYVNEHRRSSAVRSGVCFAGSGDILLLEVGVGVGVGVGDEVLVKR